jgi:hypothetical protein
MQVLENAIQFHDELMKLSQDSLSGVRNCRVVSDKIDPSDMSMSHDNEPWMELNLSRENAAVKSIPIQSDPTETTIVGIDTTNVDLGETNEGGLFALRGTVVWTQNHHYNLTRYGPFIVFATEKNKQILYNTLAANLLSIRQTYRAPDRPYVSNAFRAIFERALQRNVCGKFRNAVILWDGSLTVWTNDPTYYATQRILRDARENGNTVMGLSKKTQLYVGDRCITDLIDDGCSPCMVPLSFVTKSGDEEAVRSFGRVYVTKLAAGSCTFRFDIDRELTEEQGLIGVRRLIGNDLIIENYPETLRLAHIFSRFTATEVIGLQRYVSEYYSFRISKRPDVRHIIFGPFGGRQIMEGPAYDAVV